MSTFKRFLSLVVALVMVIGMVPGTVFATEEEAPACEHAYVEGVCTECGEAEPAPEADPEPESETPTETPTEPEILAEPDAQAESDVVYVAQIGEQGYETLAEAVAAANAIEGGATVTLLTDVTLGEKLTVSGNVTISGGKITRADNYTGTLFEVAVGAKLTLDGGLVVDGGNEWTYKNAEITLQYGGDSYLSTHIQPEEGAPVATDDMFDNYGTLEVKAATVKNSYTESFVSVFFNQENAVIILDGATITRNVSCEDGAVAAIDFANGTMTVKGDTVITENMGASNGGIIHMYGAGSTFNMEGGQIVGNYVVTSDSNNSSGTIICSYSGSSANRNTVNITGGSISNNHQEGYGTLYIHSNTDMVMSGGEVCDNTAYYPNYARSSGNTVTITGGRMTGNWVAANSYKALNDIYSASPIAISGGTYTQDVSKYCVEDYVCEDLGDGTYGVKYDPTYGMVAQVGDEYFETLKEAVEAANAVAEGATVTLLDDVTLGEMLTITGDVTIEGEKKITRDAAYTGTLFEVAVGAKLTLDGGLVVDGGHAWTFKKDKPEEDMKYGGDSYLTDHVNVVEGAPVATDHMFKNNGTLLLNKVTVQNNYTAGKQNAFYLGANSVTVFDGATVTHIANSNRGAVILTTAANTNITIKGDTLITNNIGADNGGIVNFYGQGGTLNLEGGRVEHNYCVTSLDGNSSGTIFGAYSSGAKNVINLSGTVITDNHAEGLGTMYIHTNSVFNMTGGEISNNTAYSANIYIRNSNCAANISGGLVVDNWGADETVRHDVYAKTGTASITGGTYTQDVTEYLAPNCGLSYNEETGMYSVVSEGLYKLHLTDPNTGAPATIPYLEGNDMAALVAYGKQFYANYYEMELEVLYDVKIDKSVVIDYPMTINLNGKTITATSAIESAPAFRILSDVTVIGEGKIDGRPGKSCYAFIVGNGTTSGKLTIENGTFYGDTSAVSVTKGELVINGGKFAVSPYQVEGQEDNYNFLLNCIDANYKDGSAKINVNGGVFYKFNPADNAAEGTGTNFCADGSVSEELTEDYFTVRKVDYVAQVGETKYETLKEAVEVANAVAEGATVTLLDDVTLGEKLTISGNVTIEGAYTITRADDYTGILFTINAGAKLTLDGVTVDGGNEWTWDDGKYEAYLDAYLNGTGTTLTQATMDNPDGIDMYPVTSENGKEDFGVQEHMFVNNGELIVKDSTIQNHFSYKVSKTKRNDFYYAVVSGKTLINAAANSVTTFDGATIQHNAVGTSGSVANIAAGAVVNVKGDTVISDNMGGSNGGVFCVVGTLNVFDGEIKDNRNTDCNGTVAMVYNGGTMNLSGGTLCNNSSLYVVRNGRNFAIYLHSNSTLNMTGGTICDNVKGGVDLVRENSTANISGGSMLNNRKDLQYAAGTLKLTGGTYTQDVSEWVAEGYVCKDLGDGTYGVREDPTYGKVARVGDAYFETLKEAVEAANAVAEGATVTLLTDVEATEETIEVTGNVTIVGEYTINRGSFTGTLFNVAAGATLTLDGGLTIDGNNEWTFDEASYEADLMSGTQVPKDEYVIDGVYKYVTPVAGAPVAADWMIRVAGGTVNLKNVTIQNQFAKNAGIVNADDNINGNNIHSTVVLNGTKIRNIASMENGGVVVATYSDKATITVDNVLIEDNYIGGNHGLFRLYNASEMTMNSGKIVNTRGWNSNGVVLSTYGGSVFTMNGGEICSSSSIWGDSNQRNMAVNVYSGSTVIMNGGTICHNIGYLYAGGIASYKANSTVIITGGSVVDNISLNNDNRSDPPVERGDDIDTPGAVAISGGTFTQDVTEWLAPNYGLIYDEATGVYTVTERVWEMHLTDANGQAHWLSPMYGNDLSGIITNSKVWYETLQGTYNFELKLLCDTKIDDPIVVDFPMTINLNGHTLTGAKNSEGEQVYPMIRVQGGVDVTVKNGNINNADYVFVLGAADGSSAGNLTIESGSYTGETTVASVTKGKLTINGGEFALSANDAYDYAYLLNCIDANFKDGSAVIEVKGGKFHKFNPENNAAEGAGTDFVVDGYLVEQEGEYYTVRVNKDQLPAIATITFKNTNTQQTQTLKYPSERFDSIQHLIGTNDYADFVLGADVNELLAYVANGMATDIVLTLHDDVVLEDSLYFYDTYFQVPADYKLTLDLNGHTIKVAESMSNKPAIRVMSDVTVKNGTIDATAGSSTYAFIVGQTGNSGTLTIVDGTYKGRVSAVSITNGVCNISGGNFEATPYNGAYEFLLNCIDSAYTAGAAKFNVTGGTFKGFNPENNAAEGANTDFVAEGYISNDNGDGTWTVDKIPAVKVTVTVNDVTVVEGNKYPEFTYTTDVQNVPALDITYTVDGTTINATVAEMEGYEFTVVPGTLTVQKALVRVYAKNNANAQYFASLKEAVEFAVAQKGNVPVYLLADVTVDETIVINDTNAGLVELQGDKTGGSTFTVTSTHAGEMFKVEKGTLAVKNLKINSQGDTFYVTGGTLNLNYHSVGKQFIEVTSQTGNCVYVRGGSVNVNGAKLTALGEYPAIQGNGAYVGNVTLNRWNIGDGTYPEITAPNSDMAIYWPGNGKLTVEGGKITGDTALYAKSGTIVINGGEFIGTGDAKAFEHYSNGAYATGDAVVIESCKDAAYETPTVTISGGTFTSVNAEAVMFYDCAETGKAADVMELVGGYYSTEPDVKWCVADKAPVLNDNNMWEISEFIVTVDGTHYNDWSKAKAAIKGDSVIVLYEDVVNSGSFSVGAANKTVTLDLNGHKFTTTTIGQGNHNTLHITDSAVGGSVKVTNYTALYTNGYLNVDSDVDFNSKIQIGYHNEEQPSTGCLLVGGVKLIGRGHFQQEDGIFGTTGGYVTVSDCFNNITFTSGSFALNEDYAVEDGQTLTIGSNATMRVDKAVTVTGMANVTVEGNLILTAGTYDKDVQKYCAENYKSISNGDGTWTVKEQIDVTITVDNKTMVEGNDLPELTYTSSVEMEGATVVLSTTADGNTAGEYAITATVTAPEKYKVTVVDGKLTVQEAVAKIGDVNYASLADAIEVAVDGNTITLLKKIELPASEGMLIAETITLDLNGFDIETSGVLFNVSGNLTLQDSSAEQSGTIRVNEALNNNGNPTATAINLAGGGYFTMNSGNIVAAKKGVNSGNKTGKGGGIVINGGTITTPHENVDPTDVECPAPIFVNKKDKPLNLTINGGTLTGYYVLLCDAPNSTITITGGNLVHKGAEGFAVKVAADNVVTNITGGTFTNDVTEYCADGYAAVSNGDGTWTVKKQINVIVTVNDATMVEGNKYPEFTYTTDVQNVPALNITYTVDGTTINATVAEMEGYKFTVVPGTLTIEKALVRAYAANNAKVKYFTNLNEALQYAASNNDYVPVTILGNITVNETIVFNDAVANTIELQAGRTGNSTYTITSTTADPFIKMEAGRLNLKNLRINTVGDSFYVTGGELSLNYHSKGSQFIEVTSQTGNCVYVRGGSVNVNGAKLTALGEYPAIQGNGNYVGNVTLNRWNIGDGTYPEITAPNSDLAIYWPGNGKLTVEGGKITGDTALYAKSGTIVINGGEFIADGAKVAFAHYSNGAYATGDAVVIESCMDAAYETPVVTVTGGTFTSANAKAFAVYNCNENAPLTQFISGGVFNTDIDDALAIEDHRDTENEDGTWTIKKIITITLNDQEMVAGNELPAFTYTVEDDITVADIQFSVDGDTKVPGTYNITATAKDTADYTFEIVGAKLTVKAAVCAIDDVNYASLADAVKAVGKGAGETTIKLLVSELKITHQMVGHQYAQQITIDLNGGKIYSTDKTLTAFRAGTVLTLTNGTVSGNSTGGTLVATYGGKLVLGENLTVTAGGQATAINVADGYLEINSNADVTGKNALVVSNKAKGVVISNGDFHGNVLVDAAADTVMNLSGGWYDAAPKAEWCVAPAGPKYYAAINRWTVSEGNITVDGVWFNTWDEAESSIKKNSTIVLFGDVSNYYGGTVARDFKFPANGGTITLDLNGHTFTSAKTVGGSAVTSVTVQYGTTLNIIGSGKIVIENNSYPFVINPRSTVKIAEGIDFVGTMQWNYNSGNSGDLYVGETPLVGVNGIYKPTAVTRIVRSEAGDWTLSMGSLQMTADDATLANNTLTINKGYTLDLNGHNLTAKNVTAFGNLIDSADGVGTVTASGEYYYTNHANMDYLPLYDNANGFYRLFKTEVKTRGVKVVDADTLKYGYTIYFNVAEAYKLLGEMVEQNQFSMDAVWTGNDAGFTYEFSNNLMAKFAAKAYEQLKTNGKVTTSMTLTVNGLSTLKSGDLVETIASVAAEIGVVVSGATHTYTIQ